MSLKKLVFEHDMAYGKQKDLAKRSQSDKVLRDKAFEISSNPMYDGYQRGLAAIIYKFFNKNNSGGTIKAEPNYQLPNELHRQIIRKCNRRKVYSSFRNNIWDVDLAHMQSLNKCSKLIKCLLRAIDLFSKHAWVIPLKNNGGISIANVFPKILDSSNKKPNKIWVYKVVNFTISFLRDFWE